MIKKRGVMTKVEEFKQAVERLETDSRYFNESDQVSYMSKMSNWCTVHATKFMPLKRDDGTIYIPSTAMATEFKIPRTTVHTTLNHVVTAHGDGSWDDIPIIILVPYKDVVEANGNPAQISTVDTYWSVNPDKGLVLPKSAYIIQPGNDGSLYQIGEHGATYKIGNYTPEEVQAIVSLLAPEDRIEYEKYANGDFQKWEIEEGLDKEADAMKDAILTKFLRDSVMRLSMQKMGFKKTYGHSDGSELNEIVVDIAESQGISGKGSDKGHSDSGYRDIEETYTNIYNILMNFDFGNVMTLVSALPNIMRALYFHWHESSYVLLRAMVREAA